MWHFLTDIDLKTKQIIINFLKMISIISLHKIGNRK